MGIRLVQRALEARNDMFALVVLPVRRIINHPFDLDPDVSVWTIAVNSWTILLRLLCGPPFSHCRKLLTRGSRASDTRRL